MKSYLKFLSRNKLYTAIEPRLRTGFLIAQGVIR